MIRNGEMLYIKTKLDGINEKVHDIDKKVDSHLDYHKERDARELMSHRRVVLISSLVMGVFTMVLKYFEVI